MERKRFVDPLAVQYRSSGDAVQRERHVSKRKQRNRDLEIVFDPESHRDFVTGFRKRKQQRRKEAVKSLEKLQRENMLEERAERREARREQYNLSYDDDINTKKEAFDQKEEEERTFDGREMRSTVKVSAISTVFEEEEDERLKHCLTIQSDSGGKLDKTNRQKKNGTGHRLSKTALAVLSNTRLKIDGKRKFSVPNPRRHTKGLAIPKGKEKNKTGRK